MTAGDLDVYREELDAFLASVQPLRARSILVIIDRSTVATTRPSLASPYSASGHAFLWLDPDDAIGLIVDGELVPDRHRLAAYKAKIRSVPPYQERWCLVIDGQTTALGRVSTTHKPAGAS